MPTKATNIDSHSFDNYDIRVKESIRHKYILSNAHAYTLPLPLFFSLVKHIIWNYGSCEIKQHISSQFYRSISNQLISPFISRSIDTILMSNTNSKINILVSLILFYRQISFHSISQPLECTVSKINYSSYRRRIKYLPATTCDAKFPWGNRIIFLDSEWYKIFTILMHNLRNCY